MKKLLPSGIFPGFISTGVLLFIASLTLLSCSPTNEGTDQEQKSTLADFLLPELTAEQELSFEALNTLQVSTDEMNRLYSTFANIDQPCYPPDSSFTISRADFLTAMQQFVTKHCTNMEVEVRDDLANTTVLAQDEYIVLHCSDNSTNENYENGLPMTGTWVMPSVLGRRDVTLVW